MNKTEPEDNPLGGYALFCLTLIGIITAVSFGLYQEHTVISSDEYKQGYSKGIIEHNSTKYEAAKYLTHNPPKYPDYFLFPTKQEQAVSKKIDKIIYYSKGYIDGYEQHQKQITEYETEQAKRKQENESKAILGFNGVTHNDSS